MLAFPKQRQIIVILEVISSSVQQDFPRKINIPAFRRTFS